MNTSPPSGDESRTVPPSNTHPADDLVVHGMLEFLRERNAEARTRRIARLMNAIEQPSKWLGFPRALRVVIAAAAALIIAGLLTVYGFPGENSALAEVRQSIEASRAPGVRRFDVRVYGPRVTADGEVPGATIDMLAPGLLVVHHRPPGSVNDVVVGRDERGEWAIDENGDAVRSGVRRFWPPWSIDEQTLLVDSIDAMLEQLARRYSLKRASASPTPDDPSRVMDRVTATRNDRWGPLPETVDLWIDPETHQVERVEMKWTHRAERGSGPRGGAPAGPPGPPSGAQEPRGPARHGLQTPDLFVLKQIDTPELPKDWFAPESHSRR